MKIIENKVFDDERALYGSCSVKAVGCSFDGPADGESAFKESQNVVAEKCFFNLRYPFWHDDGVCIDSCEMTSLCRAALWYSNKITVKNTKMHGIKALRECSLIDIDNCDIISPEFGWFSSDISMKNTTANGEYFMMHARALDFKNVEMSGKYSFQYVSDSVFENCVFNTKDAFWHAKNVVVRNSVVKGEYLAWYCENVTFENCILEGTQPLCYCKGLKLINCQMNNADLSFERSDVEAELTTPVISIKNPYSGYINVPSIGELIIDDPKALCKITVKDANV